MDYSNLRYQGSSNHCYDFNQGPSRQHLFSGVAPIPVTYTEMAVYGKVRWRIHRRKLDYFGLVGTYCGKQFMIIYVLMGKR